jgi:hypothetical protein
MTEQDMQAFARAMAITPGLFGLCAFIAYLQRGYFAIGGEIFVFGLPFLVLWVRAILADSRGGHYTRERR